MRFESLALERYGVFERREMVFPGPGLTVIYGPNEAGKSTSLAAVGDLLFGVPERTARGAVFGNDALRLEATLARADGTTLGLRRRKGRGKTLTDLAGGSVDESVLATLLGSTTRGRFDTLFGLDHERLRIGGEQLLKADGEIGRLIVEAGGGLRSLVVRLEAIDATLDRLFAPRKSADRAYYKALDAFEAADRAVKDGSLTREAYERSNAVHGQAQAQVSGLQEARRALSLDVSGLERMARVIPLIRKLDRLEEQVAAFADLPELAQTFDAEVAGADAARRDAERALGDAQAAAEALAARLAAVVIDPLLVAAEAPVRDVGERVVHVAKAREDRPNRLKELHQMESQLDALRRRLGAGADEDLTSRLPAPEAVEAVRRLAAAAEKREPALAAARERIAELDASIARLDLRIAAEERAGRAMPAGVATAEFAGLPAASASADVRRRHAQTGVAGAAARLAALGFADPAAARAFACPDAETLARALARDDAFAAERLRQFGLRADAASRRDAAAAEIERLQAGGEIASDAVLVSARTDRAAAWAPIRAAHVAGRPDPDAGLRQAEADALDHAVGFADEIADRRASEAQRAAGFAQAERRRDEAAAAHAASAQALAEIEAAMAAAHAALAQAFPEALARAPTLAALKALADERQAALTAADDAARAAADAETARAELATPLAALAFAERACGLSPAPDTSVTDRVRAATSAVTRHDEAHLEHRRDRRERDEAAAALEGAARRRSELDGESALWREAWTPALARLGLGAATSPDEAGAAAVEWAGARGVLDGLRTVRRRIARLDEDEDDLARRVAEVGAALGVALPEDAVAAAGMLGLRFRENDARRRDREALAPDVEDAARNVVRRGEERAAREAALAALAATAGLTPADAGALPEVARRHAERRAVRDEIARTHETIVTAGDGVAVETLREAVAARDLDAVRADLDAVAARARELEGEIEHAIRAEHEARAVLDGHHQAAGVNRAVVAREAATAELHDVVERYIELSLARDLVEAAIASVRAEQQDPLVTRAGALFSLATRRAFSGVAADVDDKGEPVVVGVRDNGGTVGASAMSDGTRDQLFLAFRLASLEAYARAAEPLPFVADDVLVHFDDDRAQATLELLAEFGGATQALLFTHHRSVLAMAEELAATGRCGVVRLG